MYVRTRLVFSTATKEAYDMLTAYDPGLKIGGRTVASGGLKLTRATKS